MASLELRICFLTADSNKISVGEIKQYVASMKENSFSTTLLHAVLSLSLSLPSHSLSLSLSPFLSLSLCYTCDWYFLTKDRPPGKVLNHALKGDYPIVRIFVCIVS